MVDFSKLIRDMEGHGISQVEIAENSQCEYGVISRLKTKRTPQPVYSVGVNLVSYHKDVCEKAFIEYEKERLLMADKDYMTWAAKMRDIHRTGLTDREACEKVGYSENHYSSIRREDKTVKGKIKIPMGKAADNIDDLYQERKDMPDKKITGGYGKQKKANYEIRMINGFQI